MRICCLSVFYISSLKHTALFNFGFKEGATPLFEKPYGDHVSIVHLGASNRNQNVHSDSSKNAVY